MEEYLKLLSEDVEYDHFLHPTLAQVVITEIAFVGCYELRPPGLERVKITMFIIYHTGAAHG